MPCSAAVVITNDCWQFGASLAVTDRFVRGCSVVPGHGGAPGSAGNICCGCAAACIGDHTADSTQCRMVHELWGHAHPARPSFSTGETATSNEQAMMHGDKHPGVTLDATLTSQQDYSHCSRPGADEKTGQRRHVAPALPCTAETVGASNVQMCSLVADCSLRACAMHPGGHRACSLSRGC